MQNLDLEKGVFQMEHKALHRAERVLGSEGMATDELREEYRRLTESYRQMLGDMERIARISDINQRKLFNSHEEVRLQNEMLYRAATTDELTGIYNRSYLSDFLEGAFSRSQRYRQVLSCILIDIDNFKQINDTFGHCAGDAVLRQLAAVIRQRIRHGDVFGRFGGEEFLIVLPNTTGEQALQLSEEIRASVAEGRFESGDRELAVTVSLGLAEVDGEQLGSAKEFLHQADVALYRAKGEGKNRAVLHTEAPD